MEGNKEIQKIKTDMKEIREMLDEIKSDTAYLRDFMERYQIPMIEMIPETEKKLKEEMIPQMEQPEKTVKKTKTAGKSFRR